MAERNMRSVNADASKKRRIMAKVLSGKISLRQIDEHADPNDAVAIRRDATAQLTKTEIDNIGSARIDYSIIQGKNAENVIGMITVPVGVAGPLKINSGHSNKEVFVPMATTEGALIASISRGMKAVNMSGGAVARVIEDGMARGPVFSFNSIVEIERFIDWLPRNEGKIREVAEGTTNHGKLKGIKLIVSGNNVFLRFKYSTGDAMGMNMVTIATEAACRYIERNFKGARLVAVSGNMCSDKKPSMINATEGRGKTVVAEALVPEGVLKRVFNTTADTVHELNYIKNWVGSARAGSPTHFNAHFANSIAAIFLATGQDAAQVVESSSGYTITQVRGRDLYISVTLPSLEVGTVGGGTGLPTQREALSIMGVSGAGKPEGSNSMKLAEIIAATVMCGELNLLAALATRELGKAHQKLGRNIRSR